MGILNVEYNVGGIEGLCVITPKRHGDSRGWFMEVYSKKDMEAAGFDIAFVQDNQSMSSKGVLRGMHFQKEHPQAKLVRVAHGKVFDVVVDIREWSATFGRWHGEVLSAENGREYLIPRGFAHGFLVLSDFAEICYKCDEFYHPEDEAGIAWNDPDLGIEWPGLMIETKEDGTVAYRLEDETPLNLSEKDLRWPRLCETGR